MSSDISNMRKFLVEMRTRITPPEAPRQIYRKTWLNVAHVSSIQVTGKTNQDQTLKEVVVCFIHGTLTMWMTEETEQKLNSLLLD